MTMTMTMRLMIVDDEPPARARLRRLLAGLPRVALVAEAGDADEALALAAAQKPDAALLDIQLPGTLNGLELAAALPEGMACAFSTAFDAHALRAFELNAVDYLLKPYTGERLAETLARLRQRLQAAAPQPRSTLSSSLAQAQPLAGHWLVPRRGGGLQRVALAEVAWVAAADNYIELHAPPACHLDRRTLAEFLAHPASAGRFLRIHRSHAVNRDFIQALAPLARGEALVTLAGGTQLRVSRGYREALLLRG